MKLNSYDLPPWFLKTLKGLLFEVFFLIALGGSVRLMNAGLACPDWPLCFGDFIPDYHPQVYLEFIHRVLAGTVALITIGLSVYLIKKPRVPKSLKVIAATTVLILVAQVVLGGLTVLWKLHSEVVAAHLGLGTAFYGLLLWIYLSLTTPKETSSLRSSMIITSIFLLLAVYGQMLLGGLVASNYAALSCTTFPLCQGQWFPTFQGNLGLNVIHRSFAYVVALYGIFFFFFVRGQTRNRALRRGAAGFFLLVLCQFCVGVANVLLYRPPLIAVIHLVIGTGLLGLATYCVRRSTAAIPNPADEPGGLS
jgi:heme A synthase